MARTLPLGTPLPQLLFRHGMMRTPSMIMLLVNLAYAFHPTYDILHNTMSDANDECV